MINIFKSKNTFLCKQCFIYDKSIRSLSAATISSLEKELLIYSNKKQTPVSLKSLMETGKGIRLKDENTFGLDDEIARQKVLIQVACFLHRELPVRLAHRAVKLEASPLFSKSGMIIILEQENILRLFTNLDNIGNVCSWYKKSFSQLRECTVPSDDEKGYYL